MDFLSIAALAGGGALGAAALGLGFFAIAKVAKSMERESGAWKGKVEEARARILSDSARAMAEGQRDDALKQAKQLGADVARERARADALQERLTDAQRQLAEHAMAALHDPTTSVAVGAVVDVLRAEAPTTVRARSPGGAGAGGGRPPR